MPPTGRVPARSPRHEVRGVLGRLSVAVLVAVLAGCTTPDRGTTQGSGGGPGSASDESGSGAAPSHGTGRDVELLRTPGDLSVTLPATTNSLREYWTDQMPAVYGKPFQELAGGVQPKTESSTPWTCGGQRLAYSDVKGNAFYCGGPQDDYIAYDAASLLPQLNEEFGALTPSVVLAHEMGHAVQARAGVDAPSVVRELQADCFAGAWVAFAQVSEADQMSVAPSALDSSVRAIPALRDQPGTAGSNPRAHGLGFDRVNAYQTGYESGASRCARFPQGEVTVTELPFRTIAEAQSGGDLPYPDTVRFAVDSLDSFWAGALPRVAGAGSWRSPQLAPVTGPELPDCPDDPGYDAEAVAAFCASSNSLTWSDSSLARLHEGLGDVASAAALSLSWARAGQVQGGLTNTGPRARLQQVCFTGAWMSALASDRSAPVSLSPGDVDEGLFTALSPLAPDERAEVLSSSFERADAFRAGLLGGLDRC